MSSRRSSHSRQSSSSPKITEDQIIDLISKLQALLPDTRIRNTDRASAEKVLKETCRYIKNLQNEVDDLSEKLAELLASTEETNSAQASIIQSLLM
ncbi:putative transcription factor bHLH family [Dioscorea sansibarensis]